MHLFVDISAHGFGHLAITAPVLNALADLDPALQLTVRSALPVAKLRERIAPPFCHWPEASDFGFRMIDANRVDLPASAEAYREAHRDWPGRVQQEARALDALRPDLVLSCVSALPLAAARQVGLPSAALCSMNWAALFAHIFGREGWAAPIYDELLTAYAEADCFLRTCPGMPMPELDNVRDIGLIATIGRRHDLGLNGDKAVLLTMGGIAHRLPIDHWPVVPGIRWLAPAAQLNGHPTALAWEDFGLSFNDLFCSVDAAITKPGYGTFAEAGANGIPLLYLRRDNWPEQDCLIAWLTEHGRPIEIDSEQMLGGRLAASLDALWQQPAPTRPAATGAVETARYLLRLARQAPAAAA